MVTIHLETGEEREHESIEIRRGSVFAYEVEDDENFFGEIERIYPFSSVVEIDPGEGEIKGDSPPGDGLMVVPSN